VVQVIERLPGGPELKPQDCQLNNNSKKRDCQIKCTLGHAYFKKSIHVYLKLEFN
jgi:hypothetical protein